MGYIDAGVLELAVGPNFATVTTLTTSGAPVASLMWVDADDDHILLNTELHRLKTRHVARDPRVHVLIVDHDDPGHYAAVQGIVTETVRGAVAREHIDMLARKYQGADFDATRIVSERIVLKVRPLRQHVRDSGVRRE